MRLRHLVIGLIVAITIPTTADVALATHPVPPDVWGNYSNDIAPRWGSEGAMKRDVDWWVDDETPAGDWRAIMNQAAAKWGRCNNTVDPKTPECGNGSPTAGMPKYARFLRDTATGKVSRMFVNPANPSDIFDGACTNRDSQNQYQPGGHYYQENVVNTPVNWPTSGLWPKRSGFIVICPGATGGFADGFLFNFRIVVRREPASGQVWSMARHGEPVEDGRYDLLGTITHEFGHAAGLRDFDRTPAHPDELCPAKVGDPESANWGGNATMCGWNGRAGMQYMRTLNSHDISAFDSFPEYNDF